MRKSLNEDSAPICEKTSTETTRKRRTFSSDSGRSMKHLQLKSHFLVTHGRFTPKVWEQARLFALTTPPGIALDITANA